MSEIEKSLRPINDQQNTDNINISSNFKLLDEEEFQRYSVLRDQELETHFQHLKIENAEE